MAKSHKRFRREIWELSEHSWSVGGRAGTWWLWGERLKVSPVKSPGGGDEARRAGFMSIPQLRAAVLPVPRVEAWILAAPRVLSRNEISRFTYLRSMDEQKNPHTHTKNKRTKKQQHIVIGNSGFLDQGQWGPGRVCPASDGGAAENSPEPAAASWPCDLGQLLKLSIPVSPSGNGSVIILPKMVVKCLKWVHVLYNSAWHVGRAICINIW